VIDPLSGAADSTGSTGAPLGPGTRSPPRRRKGMQDPQAWHPSYDMVLHGILLQGAHWADRWLVELPDGEDGVATSAWGS
jgi:hypothetical protein